MYFPNADLMINPALLVLLGLIVGMLSGFFGVGGGFLITGGLLVFGVPTLYAVGTGLALVIGTSLMNTLNHRSMGNVDYRLGLLLVAGAAPAMYGAERANRLLESHGLEGPVIWVFIRDAVVWLGDIYPVGLLARPPGPDVRGEHHHRTPGPLVAVAGSAAAPHPAAAPGQRFHRSRPARVGDCPYAGPRAVDCRGGSGLRGRTSGGRRRLFS